MRKPLLLLLATVLALSAFALVGCDRNKAPNLVGMRQQDAVRALEEAGYKLGTVSKVATDSVPLGMVAAQSPAAGERARKGEAISVAVSFSDGKRVLIPTVNGLTQVTAENVATTLNLKPLVVEEYSADTAKGTVFAQSPDPGAEADAGSTLVMVVSKGAEPEKAQVPNVKGDSESDATAAIEKAGFKVESFDVYDSSIAKGDVITQQPEAGKSVTKDSTVQIVVSLGKGTGSAKVPSVTGKKEADAVSAIESAKLKVKKISDYSADVKKGYVIKQFPAGGATAAKDSEVLILVSKGPEPATTVAVPDVTGMTVEEATAALEDAGFSVTVKEISNPDGTGGVVYQFPEASSSVTPGSDVLVVVAVAPQP